LRILMARRWSLGRLVPLTLSVNAARAGAAGDEFFHQRQKKCLAEMAKWHLRLKVERLADDVLIVFVKYNPEAQRRSRRDVFPSQEFRRQNDRRRAAD
jgi:hypothetical protein